MRVNPLTTAAAAGIGILVLIIVLNNKVKSLLIDKNVTALSTEPIVLPQDIGQEKPDTVFEPIKAQHPGIYVQGEETDSWSDERWEAYIGRTLDDTQVLAGEESRKIFERMQKTPADFKRRLESLNERIEYYEGLRRNDPSNTDIPRKLENLYILKSTLLTLENKIVVPVSTE